MKLILLFICILFLGYFSVGLLYFLINWNDFMAVIDVDDMTAKDKWVSILYTVIVFTPRNIIHDILKAINRGEY